MIDLVVLDARVARASASLQRGGDDPLAEYRDVAGKTTYDELGALKPGPIQEAHRDALRRWVAYFVDARIGWELVLEEEKRADAEDPRLADAKPGLVIARTWNEARAALVRAPNVVEREEALLRLEELADPIVAVRRERRARSIEVASRLATTKAASDAPAKPENTDPRARAGLGDLDPRALAAGRALRNAEADPRALAEAVLDATEPLARDWLRKIGGTPAQAIESAFARDAVEGWPARLTTRWLEDAFKTIAPRTPKEVPLPEALGGASFLRAAADWGHALRIGSTAKSLPFALARDPAPTEAFLYGDLLALAVASRAFQRRKMELTARSAEAQERILARTRFVALRRAAALARFAGRPVEQDEAEHLSARVYGQPLPRAVAMAWAHGGISGSARADAASRFVALLRAYVLCNDLVAAHDEDWFDNPRAAQRLGHIAAGPVHQDDVPDAAIAPRLARALEEAIG